MRCTQCDGLAVPQAVGLDPDGRVVFGWCPRCLVENRCTIVEISAKGIQDLVLNFDQGNATRPTRDFNDPRSRGLIIDQSIWLIGLVGFLMLIWGGAILGAGFLTGGQPSRSPSPLGNGTPPMLRIGGLVTMMLGLMFLTMAAHHDREFRRRLVRFIRWGGLIACLVIAAFGLVGGGFVRDPLLFAWASFLPLILSSIAFLIEEQSNRTFANLKPWEFPVVSYSEPPHPEKPRKRI
jgi:hypothetical protein